MRRWALAAGPGLVMAACGGGAGEGGSATSLALDTPPPPTLTFEGASGGSLTSLMVAGVDLDGDLLVVFEELEADLFAQAMARFGDATTQGEALEAAVPSPSVVHLRASKRSLRSQRTSPGW